MTKNEINPGGMLRCLECDGFMTGVIDHNDDGFARCPGCDMKRRLSYCWDTPAPRNPKTGKLMADTSKAMQEHVEDFPRYLLRCAAAKLESQDWYFMTNGADAKRYIFTHARDRVQFA